MTPDCSPPIPSGRYTIINKVNGNINLIQQGDPDLVGAEYRVVANPEALTVCQFYSLPHY